MTNKSLEFVSDDGQTVAQAILWEDRAPKTCKVVWDLLPVTAQLQHAIYSGCELALILPDYHELAPENATTVCLPWELGVVSLQSEDYFDVPQDFSELMFFYDRNTGPKMLDGLVKVNLFGEFISGKQALINMANKIRSDGRQLFHVRRVEA